MNFPQGLVQSAPKHLWKPVINSREGGKHTAAEQHVVNVANDKVGVVNKNVHADGRHKNSA